MQETVTEAIASIESLLHLEHSQLSELRNIHHVLTDQFELLKGIDKQIEEMVDISQLEAEM